MSTTFRILTLRSLQRLGIKHFRAHGGLNQPFVCHVGDFRGENHYYNYEVCRAEIVLMYAWCQQFDRPVIFDVGGNVGFIATQLAQLLQDKDPSIFSFEPVPHTFQKLLQSVSLLHLEKKVYPVCCALSDKPGLLRMVYSEWSSMLAQMLTQESSSSIEKSLNAKEPVHKVAWINALTLDQVTIGLGKVPHLIKVDVEGHEVNVFRGAKDVFSSKEPPAVCFELNPPVLDEAGFEVSDLTKELAGYQFFYIDDEVGHHQREFGDPIDDLTEIDWACNIFAVPATESAAIRWNIAIAQAEHMLSSLRINLGSGVVKDV